MGTPSNSPRPDEDDSQLDDNEEIVDVIPLDDDEQGPVEMEDEPDDAAHKIQAHTDDVLRIEVSKSQKWLVTGSMDDTAAVWDLDADCTEAYTRIQHVESVEYVSLNHDGTLMATGDLRGKILITRLADKAQICEITDCLKDAPPEDQPMDSEENPEEEALKFLFWHPTEDWLLAGTSEGMIWAWQIVEGEVYDQKILSCSTNLPVESAKLVPNTNQLVAIYQDGFLRLWDLTTMAKKELSLGSACTQLDVHPKNSVAAVGLENGTTVLVNLVQNKVVAKFGEAQKKATPEEEADDSLEATTLSFCSENHPWLAIGRGDGNLSIYDFNTTSIRASIDHEENAVVSLLWKKSPDGGLYIISATIDGKIRVIDARNGQVLKMFSAGSSEIFELASIEKQGEPLKLVAACSEGLVKIFAP